VKRNSAGIGRISSAGENGSHAGHAAGCAPNHACGDGPNSSGE